MSLPFSAWHLPRPSRSKYPGSFPLHFEPKLVKLVADLQGTHWEDLRVLHPFGGCAEIGDTVDVNGTVSATWVGDAHDMHWIEDNRYDLVVLDPPYSDEESEWIYGTGRLKPGQFTREAVRVCKVGGHVAVYHVRQPSRPEGTKLVHKIVVLTRTGHTARICFVYEKL